MNRFALCLLLALAALIAAAMLSLASGAMPTPWQAVWQALPAILPWGGPVDGPAQIVAQLRAPRALAAIGIGAALAAAGAAYQNLFRNPLASPDVLGVSAGAGLGAVVAILLGAGGFAIQGAAFLGGIATVALVYGVASRVRTGEPTLTLVLLGVVVGSLAASLIALAKNLADPYQQLPAITYWLMGSLAGTTLTDAWRMLALAAIALGLLATSAWRINLLALAHDEAESLGVALGRLRLAVVLAATLASAAAVATAGIIGWVGLVVPHAARLLVGADFRRVLPLAALLGATFMVLVDWACRSVASVEIAPGIVTALLGAPVFVWLLARRRAVYP